MKNVLDIKNKTKEELRVLLNEFRAKIVKLRFDLSDKKLKNFSEIEKTRRNIARVLTSLEQLKS